MSSPIGARLWGHVVNGIRFVAKRPSMYGAQSAIGPNILNHATSLHSATSIPKPVSRLVQSNPNNFTDAQPAHPPLQRQISLSYSSDSNPSRVDSHLNRLASGPIASLLANNSDPQDVEVQPIDLSQESRGLSFEEEVERWESEAPVGENRSGAAKLILAYARREHSELLNEQPVSEHVDARMLDVEIAPESESECEMPDAGLSSERFFLNLSEFNISSLPQKFEALSSITSLSLAHNRFQDVPGSVANLPNLSKLDLRNNCLAEVPSALKKAAELTHLFLAGNRIHQIAEWMLQSKLIFCDIFDLSKQRLFVLSRFDSHPNRLALGSIASNLANNSDPQYRMAVPVPQGVEPIDLSQESRGLSFEAEVKRWISDAPEGENRSAAAKLILAYARREHSELLNEQPVSEHVDERMLDVEIAPESELECEMPDVDLSSKRFFLDLSGFKISSLPQKFEALSSIRSLSLAQNIFQDVPVSVAKLPHLRELDLSNNCLVAVPSVLQNAAKLTHLFLAGNRIHQIAEWMVQSKLIFCDIFYLSKQRLFSKLFPKLLDWEDDAPTATEREEREKVSNKILDELDNPTRILLLRNHQLTSLPDIFDLLPDLESLDVSGNDLTSLPESIKNLENLKILYLQKNQFTNLPSVLGDLKQLEIIFCPLNPLRNLPTSLKNCASLTIHVDSPDSREKSVIWDELSLNHSLAWDLQNITLKAFRAEWKPLKIWHSRGKFVTELNDWNDGQKGKIRQSILCAHDFKEKSLALYINNLEIFPWIALELENLEELHLFFDKDPRYSGALFEDITKSKIQKVSLPYHSQPTSVFLEHFEKGERDGYWIRKKVSGDISLESRETASPKSIDGMRQGGAYSSSNPGAAFSVTDADRDPAFSVTPVNQGSGTSATDRKMGMYRRLRNMIGHLEPAAIPNLAANDSSSADQSSLLSSLLTTSIIASLIAKMAGAQSVNSKKTQAVESIQRLFRGHMGRNEAKRLKEAKKLAEAEKNRKPPMMRSRL